AIADLREPLAAKLRADELDEVYYRLELPLIPLLTRMEAVGVSVNREELRRLSEHLGERVRAMEEQARGLVGHPGNLGSPKQLQEVLFGELKLTPGRKTKTGYSTDSDVLQ